MVLEPGSDLWKWDGGNWTWIAGYDSVVYPAYTPDVVDNKTHPGLSTVADVLTTNTGSLTFVISWTDKDDNLWLFGGQGPSDTEGYGWYSDVWKFDTSAEVSFL